MTKTLLKDQIHWIEIDHQRPDDETSVLLFHPEFDEPVWIGYHINGQWYSADGWPLKNDRVTHWAHLPVGPIEAEPPKPIGYVHPNYKTIMSNNLYAFIYESAADGHDQPVYS